MLKTSITDFLKDMAIPPVCAVCGKISSGYLCPECISAIEPLINSSICDYCGRPLPSSDAAGCSICREGQYHFTAHRSYALYSGNMKKVIKKFKYGKIYSLNDILSGFLSDVFDRYYYRETIDYVDTVPGEHTELLAGAFSERYGIPFADNIMRIRKPERQGRLGLWERRVNILDCYKLRDCLAFRNKSILLIDDVWTTGSTLKEICRVLRAGGTKNIFLLTIARRE